MLNIYVHDELDVKKEITTDLKKNILGANIVFEENDCKILNVLSVEKILDTIGTIHKIFIIYLEYFNLWRNFWFFLLVLKLKENFNIY